MCQDVKAMAKTFLPNNFIYRKDCRTNQNDYSLSHATDYCASCCLSLYFGLHGSYTAEKQPLFASHYTQQKSRGCVPLRTLLLFCLSTTRTRSQSSWIWSSWKSRLCVRTQKSTQPQEVDVKCPLSRNERGHRLHFEKSSETGRVYESQIQWCYWWTIAVHNRNWGERIYDCSQISNSNAGWHQALLHSALFLWFGGELVGVVYTCT